MAGRETLLAPDRLAPVPPIRWSWRVARLFGIDLSVHATFLLLLVWVAIATYQESGQIGDVVAGVGLILAVFGSVVLHELGHALTARRFGIATRDITLLPIGGVARLERMPDRPSQQLAVAAAGPAVSFGLSLGFAAFAWLTGTAANLFVPLADQRFLAQLAQINFGLGLFNLLPAYPMDGGRILRALLAWRGDGARATRVAAAIGQALAIGLGVVGLFSNPMLIAVAVLIWIGAAAEARDLVTRSAYHDLPVTAAMMTDFTALAPDDSLRRAAEILLAGSQTDFPVVDGGGAVVGLLTRDRLIAGLAGSGPDGSVGGSMAGPVQSVTAEASLDDVVRRMEQSNCPVVPVTRDGAVVGLVTLENLGELVVLRRVASSWRSRATTA